MTSRKRNYEEENRNFQECWEEKYFFVENRSAALCLICRDTVKILKDYNLNRHFTTKHSEWSKFSEEVRKQKLLNLKKCLENERMVFKRPQQDASAIVRASFQVSQLIGQEMRSFSDGEFIKNCMIRVAQEICPEKVKLFKQVSLSRPTVTRRIEHISDKIVVKLDELIQNFKFFSLAFDESTDISDTAQLSVFIRGVDESFNIHEEPLDLIPMKDSTTGNDVKCAVIDTIDNHKLAYQKLFGITTDGAPAMVGKNIGAVVLIKSHLQAAGINISTMLNIHCVLHQENLCAPLIEIGAVMSVVVKSINKIKGNSLKHRQFQEYLSEIEADYGDLIYFAKVRWLSRGKCLRRFWELREEVRIFLLETDVDVKEFYDEQWLLDLCFLVEITEKLNLLNLEMQGENKLITDCYQSMKSFIAKLGLWIRQMSNRNATHFPLLNDFESTSEKNFVRYANLLSLLENEFKARLSQFNSYETEIQIFLTPFHVEVDNAPAELQMELIELQENVELKSYFNSYPKTQFYNQFVTATKFPNLRKLAQRFVSAFGTTYRCESMFSKMKRIKTKDRNQLTDQHLKDQLRLSTSKITVDIDKLASEVEKQVSH